MYSTTRSVVIMRRPPSGTAFGAGLGQVNRRLPLSLEPSTSRSDGRRITRSDPASSCIAS
jgi:hypothetical protein